MLQENDKPSKPKKNKCKQCNKKIGVIEFGCKCGGIFCAEHRFVEKHNCVCIDEIKKENLEELTKNNAKITTGKLPKI